MVREVKLAWDVEEGGSEPLAQRDSVLDEGLLFVRPVASATRKKAARKRARKEQRRRSSREPVTPLRHLAGANWTTGELTRSTRRDE